MWCPIHILYIVNSTQPSQIHQRKFQFGNTPISLFFSPFLKLKFDGSFTAHNGLGGKRGIIQNHKGKANFSFAENLLQTIQSQLKLEQFTRGFTFICIPGPILNSEGRFSSNLTVTQQEQHFQL